MRWKQLGPFSLAVADIDSGQRTANGMGWVESVAVFEKDQRYMYAGSNTGGIYCSENGGKQWRNVSPPGRISGVRDIVVDGADPRKLWIATGTGFPVTEQAFGRGVLYSSNGGRTWQNTGLNFGNEGNSMQIWQLVRSMSDPNLFFAASDTRIFRSKDGCATFNEVHIGAGDSYFRHLLIHPQDPDMIVCSGARILVSRDGGNTWEDRTGSLSFNSRKDGGGPPERIAVNFNPGYTQGLFVLYRSGYRNFIDESSDWGNSWINVNVNQDLMRVDRNHAELVAISKDEVLTGSVRMFRLNVVTDRMELLTRPVHGSASFVHDDIRDIQFTGDGKIYIGTDGGVSMSDDTGKTWKDLSGHGLTVTQVYGIAINPKNPDHLVIGCQDLGNFYYYQKKWHHMPEIYGDGGNVKFMPDGRLLLMQNGRMIHTADSGKTQTSLGQPFFAGRFTYPLDVRNTESGMVITAADKYIWQKSGRGDWKKITGDDQVANAKKSAMDINLSDPNSIFFANWEPTWGTGSMLKNRLYRSNLESDSPAWEDLTSKLEILAWGSVSAIVSDPLDPKRVWFSLYRYDGKDDTKSYKVYYSNDRGDTWVNYSEGFPNFGTYCMNYIPGSDGGIVVGTDGGVYYRSAGMARWVHLAGAMPDIMVKDMAIDRESRTLRVGTHGNGVWETRLPKSFFR